MGFVIGTRKINKYVERKDTGGFGRRIIGI